MIYTVNGDIQTSGGEVVKRGTSAWDELRKNNIIDPYVEPYYIRRKNEFEMHKITDHELTVALWELVVEGRPQKSEGIQKRRVQIQKGIQKE